MSRGWKGKDALAEWAQVKAEIEKKKADNYEKRTAALEKLSSIRQQSALSVDIIQTGTASQSQSSTNMNPSLIELSLQFKERARAAR